MVIDEDLNDPFADTPYQTLAFLGAGASARVYEVEHRAIHKRFVAKLLHTSLAEDPQFVERMLREGKALAAVQHPNLVEVVDFGYTVDAVPYLIMERLSGNDIRQEITHAGYLPVDQAVRCAVQALAALQAAHSADIIHRDIKPENLFLHLLPTGERVIKVLDLGLAKVRELSERRPLGEADYPTEKGALVGTPHYMAPEQISGGQIDGRTDVYAMGCVLYEILTGKGPFDEHTTAPELMQAHLLKTPLPPSRRATQRIPRALDRIVLRALAKEPRDRYQSAAQFELALVQFQAARRRALNPVIVVISGVLAGSMTWGLLSAILSGR